MKDNLQFSASYPSNINLINDTANASERSQVCINSICTVDQNEILVSRVTLTQFKPVFSFPRDNIEDAQNIY